MKFCPNCNTAAEDNATFCNVCGASFNSSANFNSAANSVYTQPVYDCYDHTAEFDANDIAENKIYAMLVYLLGAIGIVIALLAKKDSAYVAFHIKQAIKIIIVNSLLGLACVVFAITFIVPIAASIAIAVLTVIQIICFFDVCKGNAKEPLIIRNLNFLR